MKSKDLFRKPEAGDHPERPAINEAGDRPEDFLPPEDADGPGGAPGPGSGPMRRMPGGPRRMPPRGMGSRDDMERVMGGMPGGMEGPPGQFSPREQSQVKDIVILMLASLMHSDIDKAIATALMEGRDLDKGQLQHIIDEGRSLQLPESHTKAMEKIWKLSQGA